MMDSRKDVQLEIFVVDLEKRIPPNHLLRRIKKRVDFGFVYDEVGKTYKQGGRPSVDPVMLVKMMLIGYLYGIESERRLEEEVDLNLAYRWFLNLGINERVPDHSTLSYARTRRFQGTQLYAKFFEKVVDLCKQAGLVQHGSVVTDSTYVRANASSSSAETVAVTKTPSEYLKALEERARQADVEIRKKLPKLRRKPFETNVGQPTQKKEVRSSTDPDASLAQKPGVLGFQYKAHATVETSNGVILDIMATAGNVPDSKAYAGCIKRVAEKHQVKQAAADAGYDTAEVYKTLQDLGISAYIARALRPATKSQRFVFRDFTYVPEMDAYRCPAGELLELVGIMGGKYISKRYRCLSGACKHCSLKTKCARNVYGSFDQDAVDKAVANVGTPDYKALQKLRRIWNEGRNFILKHCHCLNRALRIGRANMQEQCHMAAAARNLRILTAVC